MAFKHGSDSVILLNAVDISAFVDSTDFQEMADSHDVTTYGNNSHRRRGGLFDGTLTIGGVYDDGASPAPKAVIPPLKGTVVAFAWRPEGTGVGKSATTGNVLVKSYRESSPVAEMIRWTAELEADGDWTTADQ